MFTAGAVIHCPGDNDNSARAAGDNVFAAKSPRVKVTKDGNEGSFS